MSRTYWIARALRSFGYAGLIVFGWVIFQRFVLPRDLWREAPDFPEIPKALFFLLNFAFWLGPGLILLVNMADCLRLAWNAGKPSRPLLLRDSAPVRSLFSDFLRENPPLSPVQWADRGFLSNFGAILFGIATLLTSFIGARNSDFPDGSGGCDSDFVIRNPELLNLASFLNLMIFMSFLGISIILAGQARDCHEIARLAELAPNPSSGTDLKPRA